MIDGVQSELFSAEHTVVAPSRAGMSMQNPYCLRYAVDGQLIARQGTMVAYRGDLTIRTKGQGVKKLLKRAVTGEGVALMEVEGKGEIWLANLAKNVFMLTLTKGDGLSVTGKSVLCFDSSLSYEIRMIKGGGMAGGGLFNCVFDGTGSLAVTSDGEPMIIPVTPDNPVRVDTDAAIGWSTPLEATIRRSEGMKSLMKGGSGEAFQVELRGDGFVVVQPSEGPIQPKSGGGIADAVGDFLGG
jgi:uncharacterized protein (AIM24 family)